MRSAISCLRAKTAQESMESARATARIGGDAPWSLLSNVLNCPGEPFDSAARTLLEQHFGYDFGQVRVLPGSRQAADSCPLKSMPTRCPFGGACHTCPTHVQAKLAINQPGDVYEQEADRVAEQVMRMTEPTAPGRRDAISPQRSDSAIRRKCACGGKTDTNGECEECKKKKLQRKSNGSDRGAENNMSVPPIVHEVLRSPGQPLDAETRAFMEPRFGHDFSSVRVHKDAKAAESAHTMSAQAYTVGHNVVLGTGLYPAQPSEGMFLLAHELAHVIQQESRFDSKISRHGPPMLQRKSGGGASGRCSYICRRAESPCEKPDPGHEGTGGTATEWTLKVMIDIDVPSAEDVKSGADVGHTYIGLSDSTGKSFTYGFYPNTAYGTPDPYWKPEVFGCMAHPDTAHRPCIDHEEVIRLSKGEFQAALGFAQSLCKAPPHFHIANMNCTTFAALVVSRAGKSLPAIRGKVGPGPGIAADSPNTLLQGIRRRDIGPTYGISSGAGLRKAIADSNATELGKAPVTEKIRVINRLLDWWVRDADIEAIEKLCNSVSSSAEMRQINRAVHRREGDLFNDDHKKRFHNAISRNLGGGAI